MLIPEEKKKEDEEGTATKSTEVVVPDSKSKEDLQSLFQSGDYSNIESDDIRFTLKSIDDEARDLIKGDLENSAIVKDAKGKSYYKLLDVNKLQKNLKYNSTYWNPSKGSYTGKGMRLSSAVQILADAQNRGYRFVPLEDGSYTIIRDGERVDPNNIDFRGVPTNDMGLLDMFTPQHNQRKNISKAMSMAIQGGLFNDDPDYLRAKKAKDASDNTANRLSALQGNKQNILDAYLSGYNPGTNTITTLPGEKVKGDDTVTVIDNTKAKESTEEDVGRISDYFDLEWEDALPLVSAGFTIASTRSLENPGGMRKTMGLLAGAGMADVLGYMFDKDVGGAEFAANLWGTGSSFIHSFVEAPSATRRRSAREVADRLMRSSGGKKRLAKLGKTAMHLLKNKYVVVSPTIAGMVYELVTDLKEGRKVEGNEIAALISVILKAKYSYTTQKTSKELTTTKKPSADKSRTNRNRASDPERSGPIITPPARPTGLLNSPPPAKATIITPPARPAGLIGDGSVSKRPTDIIPYPKGIWQREGGLKFLREGGTISLESFKNGGKLVPKGQDDELVSFGRGMNALSQDLIEMPSGTNYSYMFNASLTGKKKSDNVNLQDPFASDNADVTFSPNNLQGPYKLPDADTELPVNMNPFIGRDAPAYANDPISTDSLTNAFEKDIKRGEDILSKAISKELLDIAPGVQLYKVTVPGNVLRPELGGDPVEAYFDKKTNTILSGDELKSYLADKYHVDYTGKTGGAKTGTSYFNSLMGPQGPLGLVGWGDIAQTIGVFANKPVEEKVAKVIAPVNRPLWMPRALGASTTEKQEAYNAINNQSRTVIQGSDQVMNAVASILGAANKAKGLASTAAHFEGISREARALNDKFEAQNYQTSYENLKGQRQYKNALINDTNRINLANAKLNADFKRDKIKAITDIFGVASQNAQLKDQALKDSILKGKNWEMQIKQQELASLVNIPYENRGSNDNLRIEELRKELQEFDPATLVADTQFDINSLRWRDIFKKREVAFKDKKNKEDPEYKAKSVG